MKNTLFDEDRAANLRAWLAYHQVKKSELAKSLGVHPSMISRIISGERAPAKRIQQLIALGIPAELLPEPSSGVPGKAPLVKGRKDPVKNRK